MLPSTYMKTVQKWRVEYTIKWGAYLNLFIFYISKYLAVFKVSEYYFFKFKYASGSIEMKGQTYMYDKLQQNYAISF